jgi:hypothetical protein
MIVCHEHRFIFVKTRKTAGTSTELALSRLATGEADVVTPVSPGDEELRPAGSPPRNHLAPIPLGRWSRRPALRQLVRGRRPREDLFWKHMSAEEIRARLPEEWATYFTFAFVRNPWDYTVSRLFWERHRHDDPGLTVDDVLARWDPSQNWRQITIDGHVALDFVGRYENLPSDLDAALRRVGVDLQEPLPRAKAGTGRRGHYRELLEPRHVEEIRRRCAAEIEHFGYEF